MKADLLQALELLLEGANDVLENYGSNNVVDELSKAMNGLREDVKQAQAVVKKATALKG